MNIKNYFTIFSIYLFGRLIQNEFIIESYKYVFGIFVGLIVGFYHESVRLKKLRDEIKKSLDSIRETINKAKKSQ